MAMLIAPRSFLFWLGFAFEWNFLQIFHSVFIQFVIYRAEVLDFVEREQRAGGGGHGWGWRE